MLSHRVQDDSSKRRDPEPSAPPGSPNPPPPPPPPSSPQPVAHLSYMQTIGAAASRAPVAAAHRSYMQTIGAAAPSSSLLGLSAAYSSTVDWSRLPPLDLGASALERNLTLAGVQARTLLVATAASSLDPVREFVRHFCPDAHQGRVVHRRDGRGGENFEATIEDGALHGRQLFYFNDDKLSEELDYERGVLHGEHRMYWQSGGERLLEHYQRGELHGERRIFDPRGQLIIVQQYSQGEQISSQEVQASLARQ